MLPAVSAEDCLFADLGVVPGRRGCQSYEATDFLVRNRQIDKHVPLILWQAGALGQLTSAPSRDHPNLLILAELLRKWYGPEHQVIIYEAASGAACDTVIEYVSLAHVGDVGISPMATLFVPPVKDAPVDQEMARRLGMPGDYTREKPGRASGYDVLRPYARPTTSQRGAS